MTGSLLTLLGLALLDSVNPSALMMTLYLLTTSSYLPKVLVYLATIFTVYLAIGILLMLGLNVLFSRVEDILNSPVAYGIQGVIGALMLLYALLAPDKPPREPVRLPLSQDLGAMVLLGATVTVIELPTALPYFAAITVLTNLQLPVVQWLSVLLVYNVIFILPPLLLLGVYRLFGARVRARFERYRERLQGTSRNAWLWIAGIVGFLLLRDALAYFGFFGLVPFA